jgi:putative ABC transport system permease protein
MFKLNLKIAWRNLLKYKSYTAINIIGLALGLAGFIFIVLFINHEKSYDSWHPELKNVYQLQEYSDYYSSDNKAHWRSEIDMRLSNVAVRVPSVKAVTHIELADRQVGVTIPHKNAFLQNGFRRADSLFFKVFPFEFKYGNPDRALLVPNSIVLKESLAIKYFGNVNPIGKKINIAGGYWNKDEDLYIVTGVVKEPKTPSIIDFEGIKYDGSSSFNGEFGSPSEIYAKISSLANIEQLNKTLLKEYLPVKDMYLKREEKSLSMAIQSGNTPILKFTPLKNVHQEPISGESWKTSLKPVIFLSVLLLLVSIINFINLATAQAAGRAKEIGIKKVVGAYRKTLVFQFLTETFLQCLLAMLLALLCVEILLPMLNEFLSLNLSFFNDILFIWLLPQLLILVIIVSLLTGIYPSLFLSGYKPSQVLKGNFASGKQGGLVRKGLVSIQFVVAISFIVGILIINYQLKFLKERDNGFTATGLINIRADLRYGDFYQQLQRIDGVKYVGYSSGVLGDKMSDIQNFKYNDESKGMYPMGLSIDGLQALDARLIKGRFFSVNTVRDTIDNAIINESAEKMYGENMVGKTIYANDTVAVNIIAVVKDMQVEGFEKIVPPTIYVVQTEKYKGGVGTYHKQTTLVRFDQSKRKTVTAGIEAIFKRMNAFYPASYTFVEDDLAAVLIAHERFEKMVSVFSFLSLTLSIFGLFALAAFITRQRTKEIAVRKVLGAKHTDILVLLNKGYVYILLIANVIAFPLAYILMKRWLSTFAYSIAITPLPFVLAFFASILITMITVSLQARKAIHENPIKALKYE